MTLEKEKLIMSIAKDNAEINSKSGKGNKEVKRRRERKRREFRYKGPYIVVPPYFSSQRILLTRV